MSRRLTLLGLALVGSVLVAAAGAGAAPGAAAQPAAQIRVSHVSPGLPPVDIFINGVQAIADVPYGGVSGYIPVVPGGVAVAAVPHGAPPTATVFNAAMAFLPGVLYTVLVLPELPGEAPIVLLDEPAANPALSHVRFVNASPNAPPLDLALAGGAPIWGNVAFGQVTEHADLPPGAPVLELRQAGTLVVYDVSPVVLPPSGAITVVAAGLVGGVPRLDALVIVGS